MSRGAQGPTSQLLLYGWGLFLMLKETLQHVLSGHNKEVSQGCIAIEHGQSKLVGWLG